MHNTIRCLAFMGRGWLSVPNRSSRSRRERRSTRRPGRTELSWRTSSNRWPSSIARK